RHPLPDEAPEPGALPLDGVGGARVALVDHRPRFQCRVHAPLQTDEAGGYCRSPVRNTNGDPAGAGSPSLPGVPAQAAVAAPAPVSRSLRIRPAITSTTRRASRPTPWIIVDEA